MLTCQAPGAHVCGRLSSQLYNLHASQVHADPSNHYTSACAPIAVPLLLQGKELLSPGKNAMYNEEHKIVTPMNVGSLHCLSPHIGLTAVGMHISDVLSLLAAWPSPGCAEYQCKQLCHTPGCLVIHC